MAAQDLLCVWGSAWVNRVSARGQQKRSPTSGPPTVSRVRGGSLRADPGPAKAQLLEPEDIPESCKRWWQTVPRSHEWEGRQEVTEVRAECRGAWGLEELCRASHHLPGACSEEAVSAGLERPSGSEGGGQ